MVGGEGLWVPRRTSLRRHRRFAPPRRARLPFSAALRCFSVGYFVQVSSLRRASFGRKMKPCAIRSRFFEVPLYHLDIENDPICLFFFRITSPNGSFRSSTSTSSVQAATQRSVRIALRKNYGAYLDCFLCPNGISAYAGGARCQPMGAHHQRSRRMFKLRAHGGQCLGEGVVRDGVHRRPVPDENGRCPVALGAVLEVLE